MESRCVPLSSREEVSNFVRSPAAWRALCRPRVEHGPCALRPAEGPYCHGTPRRSRGERVDLPATLLCHDMAGGYHDDSFVDGTDNHEAYTFYNWAAVDIFCYFSHHFVTVPPLGWINVAHDHGVKVIGTVITEWSDGAAIWDKLLKCEREWRDFASELVAIAKCLRFEGWLLNIENKISKPKELLKFVTYLHRVLHEEIHDSVLIWYDSVTFNGDLAWQNELNDKNSVFFDCTDGIFINYSWTERHVEQSAARAGNRRHRVFVGLDVWGRNFYGGGKFNTVQAAQIAHKHDCSLAIFAPAWTHEAVPVPERELPTRGCSVTVTLAEHLPKYDSFLLRERALWGSLWGLMNTKLPTQLPFRTYFCRGQGPRRRLCGEVLSTSPWYNLRHMQYQPNAAHGQHGYLLTTRSNLPKLSQAQVIKNSNDIIMYRHSYDRALNSSVEFNNPVSESNLIETETNQDDSDGDRSTMEDTEKVIEDNLEQVEALKRNKKFIMKRVFTRKQPKKVDEPVRKVKKLEDINETLLVSVPGEKECLEIYFSDAFTGGSCLKVNPSDESSEEHRTSTLLHCDFPAERDLVFCIVTKTLTDNVDQYLDVLVDLVDSSGEEHTVTLAGRDTESGHDTVRECAGGDLKQLQRYLLLEVPHFYIPIYNDFGWNIRYHVVPARAPARTPARAEREYRVCTVRVRCGQPRGGLLLGHFGVCHREKMTEDDADRPEQNNKL